VCVHRNPWLSSSESLGNHVQVIDLCRMLVHGLIDRAHRVSPNGATVLQILDVLLVKVSPSHVLICAAVSTFSGRHSVSLSSEVVPETCLLSRACRFLSLYLLCGLVEVLSGVVRRAEGRAIEVIEHKVHTLSLSVLEVVPDFDVTMHLDFNVSVSLS
jgi:hypothetical protein